MEFKCTLYLAVLAVPNILIESKWNLNKLSYNKKRLELEILIESKWNLNYDEVRRLNMANVILIESKWNLNAFISLIVSSAF